jgi:hypothetical protein
LACMNCPERFKRRSAGKSSGAWDSAGTTRVRLDRSQAFASYAAAVLKDCPAAFCGVAAAKSMLPLAADFGRLILAFHFFVYKTKVSPATVRGRIDPALERSGSKQNARGYQWLSRCQARLTA